VWRDLLGQLHELPCAVGMGCGGDCAERGGTYFGAEFARCPVRETSEDWRIRAVLEVERAHHLGASWDADRYAAWVPHYLAELRALRNDRAAQESRR
jgi:hypothetical protein